jgi:pre-mRNA-processing factor 6
VPDSVLVGDRSRNEYENSLDASQQEVSVTSTLSNAAAELSLKNGGFDTPAESGTLTNFVEIGQARDKILSLKLDQVNIVRLAVGSYTHQKATSLHSTAFLSKAKRRSVTSSALGCCLTLSSSRIQSMLLVG